MSTPHRRCDRCGKILKTLTVLVCSACGFVMPIEVSHPSSFPVTMSPPAASLPVDYHQHPEREFGPPPNVTVQAGGGTVSGGTVLSGTVMAGGGTIRPAAAPSGEGTLRVG